MSKIISVHSFCGGTGKSNITANLAALIAAESKRVGVVDTDIQSPSIHVLLGLEEEQMNLTLNDYLSRRCAIKAEDEPPASPPPKRPKVVGKLFEELSADPPDETE